MVGPIRIRASDVGHIVLIRVGDKDLHIKCGMPFISVVAKNNEQIAAFQKIYCCGCPEAYNVSP